MSGWLIAIPAGTWQVSGIRTAQKLGYQVLALDGDTNAAGLSMADKGIVVDIRSIEDVLLAIRNSGIRPDGVASFAAEAGLVAVGAISDAYDLAGPDSELVARLTDKSRQRDAWDKAGLANPDWRLCRSSKDAAAAIADIAGPVILKPTRGSGSRGVTRIAPGADWTEAYARASAVDRDGTVLVESVIPGAEYNIDTWGDGEHQRTLLITAKGKVSGSGGVVANRLETPELKPETIAEIETTACRALDALGHKSGPGHVEVIVTPEGQGITVEAAGRGGGFKVFEEIVPAATGFDLVSATVRAAMGEHVVFRKPHSHAVSVRFFESAPGRIVSFAGLEPRNGADGIWCGAFVAPGESFGHARTDGDRLGYAFATAPTLSSARNKLRDIEDQVTFQIETDDGPRTLRYGNACSPAQQAAV